MLAGGAAARLQQLIDEHEAGLEGLRQRCARPQRAVDVFDTLFKSRITAGNLIMAAGEAMAHLQCLQAAGELHSDLDKDGVRWFRRAA